MKGLFSKFMYTLAIIGGMYIALFLNEIQADASVMVPLQEVGDMDNYPYPSTTSITVIYSTNNYSSFTLEAPGQVKAVILDKSTERLNGKLWLSRDILGKDILGEEIQLTGNRTEAAWFLEKGEYYMFISMPYNGRELQAAVLYERTKTEAADDKEGSVSARSLELGKVRTGFLSLTSPNDYYSFKVPKKALITVDYAFDEASSNDSATGYCTLYNENGLFLTEGSYLNSDRGPKEIIYQLEPGSYQIKLGGLYGHTTVRITPMYYDISLTSEEGPDWTSEAIDINIDTSIDYTEIIVLNKDMKESLLNNNTAWSFGSKYCVELDGETFTAADSGTYSVRITDRLGNHTMKKLEVTNIDVTAPEIEGVENNTYYNKPVTIAWTDQQSGIDPDKVTLNGKKVSGGIKVSKEGEYTLKVYDRIGNYSIVAFCVDATAPTAAVENGKIYSGPVTLKFKDNVSGLEKIKVDGMEQPLSSVTMYCYLEGEYEVELWDKAGNYRRILFYIKK